MQSNIDKILQWLYDYDSYSPYQEKLNELETIIKKLMESKDAE